MNIFDTLQQGNSANWHDDAATIGTTYYDSSKYTLKYELRGAGAALTINATPNGSGWDSVLTTTQSAGLTAGTWWWAAYFSATNVRVLAGEGSVTISPDLTLAGTGFSNFSQAQTNLQNAENALASFNGSGGKIKKYQIAGRMMEFATVPEILEVISYWKAKVLNEKAVQDMANGNGNPRRLYVGFR